ncbi:ABC transporter permease [Micromonospora sp. NBC_00898]|uniref:ABC transporter permease n=1 Tax=Micromonospora sp. NBC_00898 TaxID=2975981 RepID=UPI0038672178|nr:ABC transporter permease [Micromonospora sp. NBC_00898]
MSGPVPRRLHPADLVRVAVGGLSRRPLRAALSALGIAIGIAAMVAVVGITSSGRAELDRTLARIGTNLLRVAPGQQPMGGQAQLPAEAEVMVARLKPVTAVSAVGQTAAKVYRNDHVPEAESNGIAVQAARLDLPEVVGASISAGVWLTEATGRFPTVVLGARAAEWLGVSRPGVQVWLGGHWFTVIGILSPALLAEELDAAALVGWPAATDLLGFDRHPSTVYVRARERSVPAVRAVLAPTANPEHPAEVRVSRPSDALVAKVAADRALAGLLLGLGGVGLLVGGIGVANTMVIAVLERRMEIGLRRSLGARRSQLRLQFLTESLLLSGLGGVAGAVLGIITTAVYAWTQNWPTVVPAWASLGAVGATLVVGGLAGIYPAVRAARLAPTEALTSP